MNAQLKKQWERARRIFYRLRSSEPVWKLINYDPRMRFKKNQPTLSPLLGQVLRGLQQNGIATVRVTDLVGENLWLEMQKAFSIRLGDPKIQDEIKNRRSAPEHRGDKYYNVVLWDMPVAEKNNPLIAFSTHPSILAIVNSYMELFAKFRSLKLWASMPVPPDAPEHASQQWHRDPEDRKIVKVFLYFNDVDTETGPFTYLKKSQLGGKWRGLFPQIPPLGSYAPKGGVEKAVDPADISIGTGKAGTVIFCDTSGLHKGGYCKSKTWHIYISTYASQASLEPLGIKFLPSSTYESLLPSQRYALSE